MIQLVIVQNIIISYIFHKTVHTTLLQQFLLLVTLAAKHLVNLFPRLFCVIYVYVFVVEYLQNAYCNSAANKDFDSDSDSDITQYIPLCMLVMMWLPGYDKSSLINTSRSFISHSFYNKDNACILLLLFLIMQDALVQVYFLTISIFICCDISWSFSLI